MRVGQPTDRKYYSHTFVFVLLIDHCLVLLFHLYCDFPLPPSLRVSQPYYSTRVNAADIDSRVKELNQTAQQKQEGEGEKSKAGFWEEFDVRCDPSLFLTVAVYLRCEEARSCPDVAE